MKPLAAMLLMCVGLLGSAAGASHPTVWGDRVAWLNGKTRIVTSCLDGTGRKVLPGAPARKCYYTGE